jgi:thiamine transporter
VARKRTQVLVEIALSVALAAVLYAVFHLWLPINAFGGEIAFTMVPIMVLSLRRGVVPGMIAGALWGLLQAIAEPQFVVYPIQALLDYPVAFGLVGLTGLGSSSYRSAVERGSLAQAAWIAAIFSLVGATARFAAHVLSGIVFFAANAPAGQPVLLYSVLYNGTFILPSAMISIPASVIVVLALERGVPSTTASPKGIAG